MQTATLSPTTIHGAWFLCGQGEKNGSSQHIPIHSTPFVVGRRSDVSFCLPFQTVSGNHAEFDFSDDGLTLRDLNSTNGTFVNGDRVRSSVAVKEDDLVQFADQVFRLQRHAAGRITQTTHENVMDKALALVQFDRLMSERAIIPYFQPIVKMGSLETIGYEVLGRSSFAGLHSPQQMFTAAAQLNLEVDLSQMSRVKAIEATIGLAEPPHLFVNTHPAELEAPGLIESMRTLRQISPHQEITLEIHEKAITEPRAMRQLRSALTDLNVALAYDDFGAGQTRLGELAGVQPKYLKFDMSLIRNIHRASQEHQNMVSALVRMAVELNVIPLAEGIETAEEEQVCAEMGFHLAQGFFYGRPAPLSTDSDAM